MMFHQIACFGGRPERGAWSPAAGAGRQPDRCPALRNRRTRWSWTASTPAHIRCATGSRWTGTQLRSCSATSGTSATVQWMASRADCVVHAAVYGDVAACTRRPGTAFAANCHGTQTALDAVVSSPVKRLVLVSSLCLRGRSPGRRLGVHVASTSACRSTARAALRGGRRHPGLPARFTV